MFQGYPHSTFQILPFIFSDEILVALKNTLTDQWSFEFTQININLPCKIHFPHHLCWVEFVPMQVGWSFVVLIKVSLDGSSPPPPYLASWSQDAETQSSFPNSSISFYWHPHEEYSAGSHLASKSNIKCWQSWI